MVPDSRRWLRIASGFARGLLGLALVVACLLMGREAVLTLLSAHALDVAGSLPTGEFAERTQWLVRAHAWRSDLSEPARQLAEQMGFDRPAEAAGLARQATLLDSRNWQNWATLGKLAYQTGDLATAHNALSQAAELEHGAQAHYELGNFALLQGDVQQFWREMGRTLALAPPSQAAGIIRQADTHRPPGTDLDTLLPPARPEIRSAAITYLVQQERVPEAYQVWQPMRCPSFQRTACHDVALLLANALLSSAWQTSGPAATTAAQQAMEVWDRAVESGALQQPPARMGTLSDGSFTAAWVGPAFSWLRRARVPMEAIRSDSGLTALRLGFDGTQDDATPLLGQIFVVQPGKSYRLSVRTRSLGAGVNQGLQLRIASAAAGAPLVLPLHLQPSWQIQTCTIAVPPGHPVLSLLVYFVRPSGEARLAEPALLSDFQMEALPE